MKKILIALLGVIVVAIVAKIISNQTQLRQPEQTDASLKIGISLPLTGSIAHLGESAKKGIELAYEEFKSENSNFNLSYLFVDNAFDVKTAISAYHKLNTNGKLTAIITASSPATLATQPFAQADNILQLGIFASVPDYSTPDDLSFRIHPRAEKEAAGIISYLVKGNMRRLSVIYINNDYGKGVADSLKQNFPSEKITIMESFLPGQSDFRTQLVKIKTAKPDSVLMIAAASQVNIILRQSAEIGLSADFLASAAALDPQTLKLGAPYTDNLIVADMYDENSSRPQSKAFVEAYEEKYENLPDMFAAQGYEAFKLTAAVLKLCGKNDLCIKDYLYGLRNYPSVLGKLTFDVNGDPEFDYFMKIFKNGRLQKL